MFDHWLKWYIKNHFNWIGSFEARCLWLRSKKVKSFNNNFGPVEEGGGNEENVEEEEAEKKPEEKQEKKGGW